MTGKRSIVMLLMTYTGVLSLVPLLAARDDDFVRWHAKQGLVLGAFVLVLSFVPFLGCAVLCAWPIIALVGAVAAFRERPLRIPLVANVSERLPGPKASRP